MRELLQRERSFHDRWAESIEVEGIRVNDYFEACTAPENRFILGHLGDVKGKTLLDLGCGAGENSVYFSLKGARCTATDYSSGMVEKALKLAATNGLQIDARWEPAYRRLEGLDRLVKQVPFMKKFAWNIAVVATK